MLEIFKNKILKEARNGIRQRECRDPADYYLRLLDHIAGAYARKCLEVKFYQKREKQNAIRQHK